MYYVGQKVMCIDGNFHYSIAEWGDQIPVEGTVYTVRDIIQGRHFRTGDTRLGFHLVELVNLKTFSGNEVCFSTWRFVPFENDESLAETQRHPEAWVGGVQASADVSIIIPRIQWK
jgi:hypothetical protein